MARIGIWIAIFFLSFGMEPATFAKTRIIIPVSSPSPDAEKLLELGAVFNLLRVVADQRTNPPPWLGECEIASSTAVELLRASFHLRDQWIRKSWKRADWQYWIDRCSSQCACSLALEAIERSRPDTSRLVQSWKKARKRMRERVKNSTSQSDLAYCAKQARPLCKSDWVNRLKQDSAQQSQP